MRCMMCDGHATFDKTIFMRTTPKKIRLCDACATKVDVDNHMARIKAAPDHDTKIAATEAFVQAVGG